MSCYEPRWGYPYPPGHPKWGQYKIVPVTRENYKLEVDHGKVWTFDHKTGEVMDLVRIPCGKCIGCRLDYAREWSSRIVMESFGYPDNSLFVTLTYDDNHIPCRLSDGSGKDVRGVELGHKYGMIGGTLFKKDTQDWLKRLRRTVDYNYDHPMPIRFYLAGEYGTNTHRPHYHVCLFGLPHDLVAIGVNKLGNPLYQSELINETWAMGHTVVGKLNTSTASYTARYTLKKAQGQDHKFNDDLGIAREFNTMSRRPGIGVEYYNVHKDQIYEHDQIILPASSKDKPNVVRPPRYFDILYGAENPRRMAEVKEQREYTAEISHEALLSSIELDEISYLSIKEGAHAERLKKLIRDL